MASINEELNNAPLSSVTSCEHFRVIDSMPELDALPLGAVIQDSAGRVYLRAEGYYYDGPHDWQAFDGTFWDVIHFVMPVKLIALNAYHDEVYVPLGGNNAD